MTSDSPVKSSSRLDQRY